MKTKTKPQTFRDWLDHRGLTLQDFVNSVPGISYGFASKHASRSASPETVHEGSKALIKAVYPDCPLAQ